MKKIYEEETRVCLPNCKCLVSMICLSRFYLLLYVVCLVNSFYNLPNSFEIFYSLITNA